MNEVQEVSSLGHAEILASSFGRTAASRSCCGSNQDFDDSLEVTTSYMQLLLITLEQFATDTFMLNSEKVVITSKSSRSSSACRLQCAWSILSRIWTPTWSVP